MWRWFFQPEQLAAFPGSEPREAASQFDVSLAVTYTVRLGHHPENMERLHFLKGGRLRAIQGFYYLIGS